MSKTRDDAYVSALLKPAPRGWASKAKAMNCERVLEMIARNEYPATPATVNALTKAKRAHERSA